MFLIAFPTYMRLVILFPIHSFFLHNTIYTGIRSRRHSLVPIFLRPFFGPTGSCFTSTASYPRCLQHAVPTPMVAAPNTPSIYNCGPFSSPGTTKKPAHTPPIPSFLLRTYRIIPSNDQSQRLTSSPHKLKVYIHHYSFFIMAHC